MSTPFLKNPADIRCALTAAALLLALLFSDTVLNAYMAATTAHPFAAGFCKFAVLATFGECLAQRMLRGRYLPEGFGLVPRAVIWGALGVCITVAFTIFSAGAPQLECLARKPDMGALLASVDWNVMWRVVLFRSLLFFWVPAHTVTFLLPPAFRVLFAAPLGAVLGLILAWAGSRRAA